MRRLCEKIARVAPLRGGMKLNRVATGAAVAKLVVVVAASAAMSFRVNKAGPLQKPEWAYAVPTKPGRPAVDRAREGEAVTFPGTTRSFTRGELINVKKAPNGLADWFPEEHPVPPTLVSRGDMTD